MFPTRVFRAATSAAKFLEAGAPTGLTGLLTHASPRASLIGIYNSTLSTLSQMPESSVYRVSTEALTRQRLSILESVQPQGYEAWQDRLKVSVDKHLGRSEAAIDELVADPAELKKLGEDLANLEPEPPLSADQIEQLEQKIGAGLIEEVIQVAEGEKLLAQTMLENKVWEELEEKPVEGQWTYHERGTHTPITQAP